MIHQNAFCDEIKKTNRTEETATEKTEQNARRSFVFYA